VKVLITVPCLHWVQKHVVHRLLLLQQDQRYATTFQMPSNKPFENNLHHIVKDLLAGDWDFWLSMDADNPPSQNPLDLIALNKDIIGLPTPIWHYTGKEGERPIHWNAYDWDGKAGAYREHTDRDGLQRVDAIGTGCFLAHRRVFEHGDMKAPFQRTYFEDGTVEFGNDLAFSQRATKAGFEIYAHYDYPCDHFNEVSLNEVARAIKGLS
jgi:hypothetical protein